MKVDQNILTKTITRRGELASELEEVRGQIAQKRAVLGEALLSGKSPNGLEGELAKLEARASGLAAAIEQSERLEASQKVTLRDAERKAQQGEINDLRNRMRDAAFQAIREGYRLCDFYGELLQEYQQVKAYGNKCPELDYGDLYKTWSVIVTFGDVVQIGRRAVEFATPDLVEKAGCHRRF